MTFPNPTNLASTDPPTKQPDELPRFDPVGAKPLADWSSYGQQMTGGRFSNGRPSRISPTAHCLSRVRIRHTAGIFSAGMLSDCTNAPTPRRATDAL